MLEKFDEVDSGTLAGQELLLDGEHVFQDMAKHFAGKPDGINVAEQFGGIEIEYRCRFRLVDFEAVADHRLVGVVGSSLLAGTVQDSLHQRLEVVSGQVQYKFDVDIAGDHFALCGVSGDAVQQQDLASGVERAVVDPGGKLFAPQRYGEVVGDEVSTGGVLGDSLRVGRVGIEAAKDVAAGEMEKAGESAEDEPLRALSAAGCTEEQDGGGW